MKRRHFLRHTALAAAALAGAPFIRAAAPGRKLRTALIGSGWWGKNILKEPLLGMISWRTGRSLAWDVGQEEIVGDAEATKLISRPYRAPWIYPTIG